MSSDLGYSVNPASGAYGSSWPGSGAVPESYSAAGWTLNNEGFTQQTFLGGSVRNFSAQGAFGDSSSMLSVSLVDDEFNTSDGFGLGIGDDVYHNGVEDEFNPPPVGSPVFFKFGKGFATIEQSWRKTFDDIYDYHTFNPILELPIREVSGVLQELNPGEYVDIENSDISGSGGNGRTYTVVDKSSITYDNHNAVGSGHFVFGGILQRYKESNNTEGKNLYDTTVVDPREILSNTTLILNNYSDSTLNCPNLINIFGFLEYNPTTQLRNRMNTFYENSGILTKEVQSNGTVIYRGGVDPFTMGSIPQYTDSYARSDWLGTIFGRIGPGAVRDSIIDRLFNTDGDGNRNLPNEFPFTGTSYCRRCEKGVPFYRIVQGINALMGFAGPLPEEYEVKNFGGRINFRGFNYVVDFTGLPSEKIPPMYFFDFDQMTLMEFLQEFCETISHDLYVSLLPVIDHPGCDYYYKQNKRAIENNEPENLIAGIIRIDTIDRSVKPEYGAIDKFIKNLEKDNINVTSKEVGYELSNISTDKFIVGAQEVEMHYFTTNGDRDHLEVRKSQNGLPNRLQQQISEQWHLSNSLKQQVLPFYGFLGKDAITIPRGYGSFQQIMLDTTSLNANGVGNYYVATEIELRAASVSFEAWKEFLLQYNDLYMESTEEDDIIQGSLLRTSDPSNPAFDISVPTNLSNNYAVTVPRCIFRSERNYMGEDGLPASPCNPPFGYPLYYKRGLKIGLPEAGLAAFYNSGNRIVTSLQKFESTGNKNWKELVNSTLKESLNDKRPGISPEEKAFIKEIKSILNNANSKAEDVIALIQEKLTKHESVFKSVPRLSEKHTDNALKIYNFVKGVADQNLGRKFLVKIPKETNSFYSNVIGLKSTSKLAIPTVASTADDERVNELQWGPFGFMPRKISDNIGVLYDSQYNFQLYQMRLFTETLNENVHKAYLDLGIENGVSSLVGNYLDGASFVFDRRYGALQSDYNGVNDKHEFNYRPEPQGGFYEFGLFNNLLTDEHHRLIPDTSKLPLGIQQALMPRDLTNFLTEQNRVTCYARFDNSQFLNFSKMPEGSIAQQAVTREGYIIPDVTNQLENMEEDQMSDFPNEEYTEEGSPDRTKFVAFVKCELDERFYMPPRVNYNVRTEVFAREVDDIGKITPPSQIWSESKGKFVDSYPIYKSHFIPSSGDGTPDSRGGVDGTDVLEEDFMRYWDILQSGELVNTAPANQDSNHVYALITLPAQIQSTIDSRMKDGPFQTYQAGAIKHFLAMDTVKGVNGLEKPAIKGKSPNFLPGDTDIINVEGDFTSNTDPMANAFNAHRAALKSLSANSLSVLNMTNPSPVYPDLVAIPLMSQERCYGPWLSSQVESDSRTYAEIPGKVDFIKDENLAPWNYAGYQLMDEAGKLQAQFSNSLQLFTENGSLSYEGLPSGNTLCSSLIEGGPLVTNIDVSIGASDGVNTNYSMNIYTPRFGRLQKQRQDLISQISRQRQQITDERNALIRKGMGKAQKSVNYAVMKQSLDSINGASRFADSWAERVQRGEDLGITEVAALEETTTTHVGEDGKSGQKKRTGFSDTSRPSVATRAAIDKAPTEADKRNVKANSATRAPSPPASRSVHPSLPAGKPVNTHFEV